MRKQKKKLVRCITALILAICFFIPAFSEAITVSAKEIERAAPVDLITLNKNYLVLTANGTQTVTAEHPGTSGSTSVVSWSTADSSVATVSPSSGNTVTVTARKSGFTTLTAYKGSRSVSIPVYVVKSGLSGTFFIQGFSSKRIIDVENMSKVSGSNLIQNDYYANRVQKWKIESVGNYYTIKSVYSGNYIGIANTQNDSVIQQHSSANTDNEKWVILPESDGSYRFIPVACLSSSYSLSIVSGSTQAGANLCISKFDSSKSKWAIRNDTVKVQFTYDHGFIKRNQVGSETDAETKEKIANNIKNNYLMHVSAAFAQCGIFLELNTISNYLSDADSCPTAGTNINANCTCITTERCILDYSNSPYENNNVSGFVYNAHHKSIVRLRNNLISSIPNNTIRVTYTGHIVCCYNEYDGSHDYTTKGLADYNYPIICIRDAQVNNELRSNLVLAHELSHIYGIVHHDPIQGTPCIMDTSHYNGMNFENTDDYWCSSCKNTIIANKDKY